MKKIIKKSYRFIIDKWNLSMDDLNLLGKIILYFPIRINNVLTQIFYFALFPFVCFYIYLREILDPFLLAYNLYMFNYL
jgi:hypothetical protein